MQKSVTHWSCCIPWYITPQWTSALWGSSPLMFYQRILLDRVHSRGSPGLHLCAWVHPPSPSGTGLMNWLNLFFLNTQKTNFWSTDRLRHMSTVWHIAECETRPSAHLHGTYLRLVPPSALSYSSPPGRVWTKSERWDSSRTRHNSASVCCWNGSRLNRSGPQKRTGSWIRIKVLLLSAWQALVRKVPWCCAEP